MEGAAAIEVNDVIEEGNITNFDAALEADRLEEERVHITVKMKLNTLLMDKAAAKLKEKIGAIVLDGNKLMAEAYAFANLHILRLLDNDMPLPRIDRSFYYRCLLAVSESKARPRTLGDDFKGSMAMFDACREQPFTKVNVSAYNQMVADLPITMATMATNHLWMNLES